MMCIGKNKVPLVVIFKIKFCPENFLLNYRIIFLIVSFVLFLQNSLFLECIFASFGLIMETSHVYCQRIVQPPILVCFDFFYECVNLSGYSQKPCVNLSYYSQKPCVNLSGYSQKPYVNCFYPDFG